MEEVRMGEGWAPREACTYSHPSLFMLPPAQSLTVSKEGKLILWKGEPKSAFWLDVETEKESSSVIWVAGNINHDQVEGFIHST